MSHLFSSEQLRKKLNQQQFEVTRRKQTQQSFQNEYWNFFGHGIYKCIVCGKALFSSQQKYEDGFGWPAFYDQFPDSHIKQKQNHDLDYVRIQALCSGCDSHLGFIFKDGPVDCGGKRYSVNSASLKFEAC